MDPYLEQRALWPDVHNSLITALRDDMAPRLRPRYFVAVEERTYIDGSRGLTFAGRPDVTVLQVREAATRYQTGLWDRQSGVAVVELPVPDTIHELYLEIREQDDRVVTVVEVLSPANKMPGEGRDLYERKRMRVLSSLTNLVEIDLLRIGQPMAVRGNGHPAPYRILVSRAASRPWGELYYFGVRNPIPEFVLPLQPGDAEPVVALNQLLHALYDRAGYDLRIDYRQEPEPPLEQEDVLWSDALLRQAALR
jgi:hypothetical protein